MQRIYDIKQRQATAPLAICVGDAADVERYAEVAHLPAGLLRQLLPGATTVVLRRRPDAPLSPGLNPGVDTIGELRSAAEIDCYVIPGLNPSVETIAELGPGLATRLTVI